MTLAVTPERAASRATDLAKPRRPALTAGVDRLAAGPGAGAVGGDVDEPAPAALAHAGQERPGQQHRRPQVHLPDEVPAGRVALDEALDHRQAGDGGEDVDLALGEGRAPAGSARSAGSASTPRSAASASSLSPGRSVASTVAPAARSATQTARPMSLAAPLTSAVRPVGLGVVKPSSPPAS